MLLSTPKTIKIKLGDNTLDARVPRMRDMAELFAKQQKGVIKDVDFSIEFLFAALQPCNPDLTLEELNDYLTVDMAEDISNAFGFLGLSANKKK